jgi:hypothetical protein
MAKRATRKRAPSAALIITSPRDLKWERVVPGAEIAVLSGDLKRAGSLYAIRIRLRDAFVTPPHWHPQDEHITVLQGTFLLGFGRRFDPRKLCALRPRTHAVVPKRKAALQPTTGHDPPRGARPGPFNTIYVNPAEDPTRRAAASERS